MWAIVACLAFFAIEAQATTPDEFVEDAVDQLARTLDGRKEELAVDAEALYAVINEILLPRFDRRFAAGQVLAKHWRRATAEQRNRFVQAFYTAMLHRYAEGVLEFENDRVEVLPYRGDDSKRITSVKTIVRLEDGTRVPVNYTLVKKPDGWRMFDVTIEGVSYVRNYRVEFDSEIRASSLEEVITRLEDEADNGLSEEVVTETEDAEAGASGE